MSKPLFRGFLERVRRRERVGRGPWKYVPHPQRMRRHTRVFPLRSGSEAFPAMLDAIAKARVSVLLEMYIWNDDVTGNRFREAFIDRAKNGCTVRILYDAVGSFSLPESFVDTLRDAGAEVILYHPVAPWRPRWSINRRDHKKILVVDNRVGFTGGINLSDDNLPIEEGGKAWFDWHVGVEGPAVYDLAASFRHTWLHEGGTPYALPEVPPPFLGRNVLAVQVISSVRLQDRWRMHRSYLWAIRHAHHDISIMNSYFLPELGLRRAFRAAVQRGVSVRVILPQTSDVAAVAHASRHIHKRLIQNGIRVFEWPPERMMHAKLGIIDDVWSTIGSYNLDRRSLYLNLEVMLVTLDEQLGHELREQFEKDIARCTEVTIAKLDARGPWQKFLDWFWYQLRSQL